MIITIVAAINFSHATYHTLDQWTVVSYLLTKTLSVAQSQKLRNIPLVFNWLASQMSISTQQKNPIPYSTHFTAQDNSNPKAREGTADLPAKEFCGEFLLY